MIFRVLWVTNSKRGRWKNCIEDAIGVVLIGKADFDNSNGSEILIAGASAKRNPFFMSEMGHYWCRETSTSSFRGGAPCICSCFQAFFRFQPSRKTSADSRDTSKNPSFVIPLQKWTPDNTNSHALGTAAAGSRQRSWSPAREKMYILLPAYCTTRVGGKAWMNEPQ